MTSDNLYSVFYDDEGTTCCIATTQQVIAQMKYDELKAIDSCRWAELLYKPHELVDNLEPSKVLESFSRDESIYRSEIHKMEDTRR